MTNDKELKILRTKELRGDIILKLYDHYCEKISLRTLFHLVRPGGNLPERETQQMFDRAVGYLVAAGIATIITYAKEHMDSTVDLLSKGVKIAEGDEHDSSVIIHA